MSGGVRSTDGGGLREPTRGLSEASDFNATRPRRSWRGRRPARRPCRIGSGRLGDGSARSCPAFRSSMTCGATMGRSGSQRPMRPSLGRSHRNWDRWKKPLRPLLRRPTNDSFMLKETSLARRRSGSKGSLRSTKMGRAGQRSLSGSCVSAIANDRMFNHTSGGKPAAEEYSSANTMPPIWPRAQP